MSHYEATQLAADQLWIPGANYAVDDEYPTPTSDELVDLWQGYLGTDATAIPTPDVYGAMRVPDAPPTALISIDACEVLRHTNVDITRVERHPDDIAKKPIKSIHVYGEGCTYEDNHTDIQVIAQALMGADLVRPVEGIDQMNKMMQRWRAMGAYVVFNTSTLPGCEPGTIRFFNRYLPGAADALLLPRNHNSDASLATKGDVAADLALTLEQMAFGDKTPAQKLERELTAIHIDDKPCHNVAFRERMTAIGASACTLQPMYPSHLEADQKSIRTRTPLDAFRVANVILRTEIR